MNGLIEDLAIDETKELLKAILYEGLSDNDCIEIIREWVKEAGINPQLLTEE